MRWLAAVAVAAIAGLVFLALRERAPERAPRTAHGDDTPAPAVERAEATHSDDIIVSEALGGPPSEDIAEANEETEAPKKSRPDPPWVDEREPAPERAEPVHVSGTLRVEGEAGAPKGTFRLTWTGRNVRDWDELDVRAGAWSATVPSGSTLAFDDIRLGGRLAVAVLRDVPASGRVEVACRWFAPTALRVLDAETGADLAAVEVVRLAEGERLHDGSAEAVDETVTICDDEYMTSKAPRPADALRETLPTTKDAVAFFDLVAARLGERAIIQTSNGAKNRRMFVHAGGGGPFLLPWPLLSLSIADRPEGELPDEDPVLEAPTWTPGEPIDLLAGGIQPTPAMVKVHDGALSLGVEYRWNGRWRYTTEPGERDAFADLVPALGRSPDDRLGLLANYVLSMDVGRHGPARVLLPRQTPGGVEGAWSVGCQKIRRAMALRRTPAGSFWAVADGYVGTALAFGASRDEVLAAWRKEVEHLKPKPPAPPNPEDMKPPESEDVSPREWTPEEPAEHGAGFIICFRGWDAPPFDPSPAYVPAAIVRVAALPVSKPAKGSWTRWLGDRGVTHFAIRLPISGGYTLVGEPLLSIIDLETIDAKLDALDEANPSLTRGTDLPAGPQSAPRTHATVYYRCTDLGTGLPIEPRAEQSQIGAGFDAGGFDGSRFASYVVRVREIGADA